MHLTPVVTFRPTKIKVWTIVSPFTLGFFIRFLGSVFVFWGTLTMHSTLLLAFTSTKTNEGAFCMLHQRAECMTRLIFSCVSSSVGSLLVCSSTSKGKQQKFHSAPTLILSVFHTHSLSLLSPPPPPLLHSCRQWYRVCMWYMWIQTHAQSLGFVKTVLDMCRAMHDSSKLLVPPLTLI